MLHLRAVVRRQLLGERDLPGHGDRAGRVHLHALPHEPRRHPPQVTPNALHCQTRDALSDM